MSPTEPTGAEGILEGLTVIEIGTNIACPFACRLLADNGARVIKVEPPWGAPFRSRSLWYDPADVDGFTYRFLQYNAGKESLSLDLKSDAGKAIFRDLLADADVLIENMTAGTLATLGFSWEAMHDHNPELIYCSITGYGESGSFADNAAYDTAIQGMAGWVYCTGDTDAPETNNIAIIDHLTALYTVIGTLMALTHRGITGRGQKVEVAMIDVAVSLLGHQYAEYSAARADDRIDARYDPYFEPGGIYACKDGHLIVLAMPEFWEEFAGAIGRPAFAEEGHTFATNTERVRNAEALKRELESVLRERTIAEWIAHFSEHAPHVAVAPVTPIEELPESPIVEERGLAVEKSNPAMGDYVTPAHAVRYSRAGTAVREVPRLGEQTESLVRELGYSGPEIESLRSDGVIN